MDTKTFHYSEYDTSKKHICAYLFICTVQCINILLFEMWSILNWELKFWESNKFLILLQKNLYCYKNMDSFNWLIETSLLKIKALLYFEFRKHF